MITWKWGSQVGLGEARWGLGYRTCSLEGGLISQAYDFRHSKGVGTWMPRKSGRRWLKASPSQTPYWSPDP